MAAPAKPEAKPAPAAPDKDKPAADGAATAAPTAKGSALKAWLPALVILVLAPAGSFALAEFVLLPRLQAKLAAPAATAAAEDAEAPAAESAHSGEKKGHGEKEGAAAGNYEFANVVVNLAGTMGTRYLKTSFVVTGVKNVSTKGLFEADKAKLTDITLNVLSSLSLADLEEPGSKNVLREKLVAAYNQALGKRVVEQVYFSDFVIQ
ncbi:MAG: flagellar basal body-associated FliL family protein [Lacunisphaera sp.]|nr:flagellar basal body-associated FliL family protein [Lacunisphaera sp.]